MLLKCVLSQHEGEKMKSLVQLAVVFLCLSASTFASHFGFSGRDGRDGQPGYKGDDGHNVSVIANGEELFFDLRGGAGSDASYGEYGEDAYGCSQPYRPPYSLYGANGGDAGDGAPGGRGGNGGDALVFTDSMNSLASVTIFNSGGEGGYGSEAGLPGRGCYCQFSSWSVQSCYTENVCRDVKKCRDRTTRDRQGRTRTERICSTERVCTPQRRCQMNYYSCFDGRDGSAGRSYGKAGDGSRGSIRVVQGLEFLPSEYPYQKLSLKDSAQKPMELSKQIWSFQSGARALFSYESDIGDEYSLFERLAKKSFQLNWQAERSIDEFSGSYIEAHFDGINLDLKLSSDIFAKTKIEYSSSGVKELVIQEVLKGEEIGNVSLTKAEGLSKSFESIVKDNENLGDLVKTTFLVNLKYKKKFLGGWETVHQGELSDLYIEKQNGQFILRLGQLPLPKPAEKIFKKRRRVSLEVIALREFGGKVKRVKMIKNDFRL